MLKSKAKPKAMPKKAVKKSKTMKKPGGKC